LNQLNSAKIEIFNDPSPRYRLEKTIALIGDAIRQNVTFPMDVVHTDQTKFFGSLFADYSVYIVRDINPVQPDMGDYSRSDFSHITPTNKTVNIESTKGYRSLGAYAIPGVPFTVTRTDSSAVDTCVQIQIVRNVSKWHQTDYGYFRPKWITSECLSIKKGESLTLTSPYGGPILTRFGHSAGTVQYNFENVGEHAYWRGPQDDVSFAQKLEAGEYDWAELATDRFEVHSKLDKMRNTVASWPEPGAAAVAAATQKYTSNYPYLLAGYKGDGIDVVDEIHDFAAKNNLEMYKADGVQHMNADKASCGYGCSGNPYDAGWSFYPIGHGDLHELGHGLQKNFGFEGWNGHAYTNPYSYYTKSRFNKETPWEDSCQELPFEEVYGAISGAAEQENKVDYMRDKLWTASEWSHQFLVMLQAMMHAEKYGELKNGWHMYARMHVMQRELREIEKDWENRKASIGFSTYTLDEFNNIAFNDQTLIFMSYAGKLDYREFLDMLGLAYSQKASNQVASFGYKKAPKEFFISENARGYCTKDTFGDYLAKASVVVNGEKTWNQLMNDDTDKDGSLDLLDKCPKDPTKTEPGLNGCGVSDADADGDGVTDFMDAFPNDASESVDTDGDGIGNNADTDDDNDGIEDSAEIANGLNPLDASDADMDSDGDGISNKDEINSGNNPLDISLESINDIYVIKNATINDIYVVATTTTGSAINYSVSSSQANILKTTINGSILSLEILQEVEADVNVTLTVSSDTYSASESFGVYIRTPSIFRKNDQDVYEAWLNRTYYASHSKGYLDIQINDKGLVKSIVNYDNKESRCNVNVPGASVYLKQSNDMNISLPTQKKVELIISTDGLVTPIIEDGLLPIDTLPLGTNIDANASKVRFSIPLNNPLRF
jgi:hypothetical protein